MRTLVACLLCAVPCLAQDPAALLVRGRKEAAAGRPAEAQAPLRDAILAAELAGAEELRALCLLELAALHGRADFAEARPAAVAPLLRTAAAVAARIGRTDLEARARRALHGRAPDDETWRALVDAAVAGRDLAALEEVVVAEPADSPRAATLKLALEILDGLAQADWMAGTRWARVVEPLLNHLLPRAREAGLARSADALLVRAAALKPGLWAEVLERARATGDLRARARAQLGIGTDLADALASARLAGDFDLQLKIVAARGEAWAAMARQTERRYRRHLAERAALALEDDLFRDDLLLPALRRFEADDEIRALLLRLDPPPPAGEADEYVAALRRALADDNSRNYAATVAAIAGRPEAFAPLADSLTGESSFWSQILAIESLATRADRERLLQLLDHPLTGVREAAAAALFRLGVDGLELQTLAAVAVPNFRNDLSRLYLKGALAKAGHPRGFLDLRVDAQSSSPLERLHAAGVLAALGFGTPVATIHELAATDVDRQHLGRVLARTPRQWGATLVYAAAEKAPSEAVRAAALRGDRERVRRAAGLPGVRPNLWRLPRDPDEAPEAAMDLIGLLSSALESKPGTRDVFEWAAGNGGMTAAELDRPPAAEGEEEPSALRDLVRAERRTRAARVGATRQNLVLLDFDEAGAARCHIRAEVGRAELVDNRLQVPFRWKHQIKAIGYDLLAGAFYKSYVMEMAAGQLLKGATVVVPGHEPVAVAFASGPEGWSTLVASLPYEELGEGLGESRTIPVERLVNAVIRVDYDFNGNPGHLEFPLAYAAPTRAKKPDLVPLDLVVEPPAPAIGEEARITVRVRNDGRSVAGSAIVSVRFEVSNPQREDGWRTLDVRIEDAAGWRAGEVRTYRVRPRFVRDYYMNKYSHTWTPAVGDSVLAATVDADGALEEENEDNNRIEQQAALDLPEEEAKQLAGEELLAALRPAVEGVAAARTLDEMDRAYAAAAALLDRARVRTADIEAASRHLLAIARIREFRLRTEEAIARLHRAESAGTVSRDLLRQVEGELARAKRNLLGTGVPISLDTINAARNHVLAASNLSAAHAEYGDLASHLGPAEVETGPSSEVSRTLKALDGALLMWRYARERAEGESADVGDVMDAASDFADAADVKIPGLSNLHRALLKAELDYVDKGMRKNAAALETVAAMIAGEEGAEARMAERMRDVEGHITAGPFTREALGEIAKGWAKDIPVLGQILDVIWSAR